MASNLWKCPNCQLVLADPSPKDVQDHIDKHFYSVKVEKEKPVAVRRKRKH